MPAGPSPAARPSPQDFFRHLAAVPEAPASQPAPPPDAAAGEGAVLGPRAGSSGGASAAGPGDDGPRMALASAFERQAAEDDMRVRLEGPEPALGPAAAFAQQLQQPGQPLPHAASEAAAQALSRQGTLSQAAAAAPARHATWGPQAVPGSAAGKARSRPALADVFAAAFEVRAGTRQPAAAPHNPHPPCRTPLAAGRTAPPRACTQDGDAPPHAAASPPPGSAAEPGLAAPPRGSGSGPALGGAAAAAAPRPRVSASRRELEARAGRAGGRSEGERGRARKGPCPRAHYSRRFALPRSRPPSTPQEAGILGGTLDPAVARRWRDELLAELAVERQRAAAAGALSSHPLAASMPGGTAAVHAVAHAVAEA